MYACQELFDLGIRSPPTTPKDGSNAVVAAPANDLMPLSTFAKYVSKRAQCTIGTMLVSYVYLKRILVRLGGVPVPCKHSLFPLFSSHLCISATAPSALHRVLFTAMMIAHKLWNDSSMIGKHWAEVSATFTSLEVLRMERDFLRLLNYDTNLSLSDVLFHASTFLDSQSSLHRLVFPTHVEHIKEKNKDKAPPLLKRSHSSFISPPLSPTIPVGPYPRTATKRRRSPTEI